MKRTTWREIFISRGWLLENRVVAPDNHMITVRFREGKRFKVRTKTSHLVSSTLYASELWLIETSEDGATETICLWEDITSVTIAPL